MHSLVTIVMAAYNSERFVAIAIASIQAQTHKNWELLCIDDGSTDETGKIIGELSASDSRIKLLSQSNAGPASARQMGFNAGRGDYFTILDSDDWLDRFSIETALREAIQFRADSVVYRALVYDRISADYISFHALRGTREGALLTGRDAFQLTLPWRIHGMALWHRDVIKSEAFNKEYPLNNFNADEYITRRLFLKCKKVYIGSASYYIRENPDSLTRRFSPRHLMAVVTDCAVTDLAIQAKVKPEIINYALETQYNSIIRSSSMLMRWGADGDEMKIAKEIFKAVIHYRRNACRALVNRGVVQLGFDILLHSVRSFLGRCGVLRNLYRKANRCLS